MTTINIVCGNCLEFRMLTNVLFGCARTALSGTVQGRVATAASDQLLV